MGYIDRLKAWMTVPAVETTTFRCTNCAAIMDGPEAACPDCGGDVEEIVHQPVELYWPQH